MATMATTPKASVTTLPPRVSQAPIAKGSRNVAVMGPEATPPESKAMAVKIFGTTKDKPMAHRYPGTSRTKIEMPVRTRSMARPMDTATPMDRLVLMALPGIAPEVSSSTCRFSTWTAGSACTMNQPISIPMGIRTQLCSKAAIWRPK